MILSDPARMRVSLPAGAETSRRVFRETTMISDVLFDAAATIRDYQQQFPDVYADDHDRIARVLREMDLLRERLDDPRPCLKPMANSPGNNTN
jgi:hypothetical protein